MPHTFAVGELVTAATLNALGAFTSYTTTWSGTLGNGSKASAYTQIGKTVHFRIALTWGTTTTHPAAFQTFTVPVAPAASYGTYHAIGAASCLDTGINVWSGQCYLNTGSIIEVTAGVSQTNTTAGHITNLVPMTWANGDTITITGTYEAA